jgi:hypothetical protein
MKQLPFLIFLVLISFACKQKNESLTPAQDTLNVPAEPIGGRKLVFQDCNAIIVGEGVRLRTSPDVKAEVVEKLNTGILLKIIKRGDKKVHLGQLNVCDPDGFYWYEVMEAGGKRGWVYGEFLYELVIRGRNDDILDETDQILMRSKFTFNDKLYGVGYANAVRTGIVEQVGAPNDTTCIEYLMPFLYQENEGQVYPLRFITNKRNRFPMTSLTRDMAYFQYSIGGRFDDYPDVFRMTDNELQITMVRDLEEEEEEDLFIYTLRIKAATGYFTATPADSGKEYRPE